MYYITDSPGDRKRYLLLCYFVYIDYILTTVTGVGHVGGWIRSNSMEATILHFGYGSNMKKERMLAAAPSAKLVGPGKLCNYELFFIPGDDNWWEGAVSNIRKKEGRTVWGAIWEMPKEDEKLLDKVELLDNSDMGKVYYDVETLSGETVRCMSYSPKVGSNFNANVENPLASLPSLYYISTISDGAKEVGLPLEYQQFLNDIKHNGRGEDRQGYPSATKTMEH